MRLVKGEMSVIGGQVTTGVGIKAAIMLCGRGRGLDAEGAVVFVLDPRISGWKGERS